jgi:hypothetical protein
VHQEKNTTVFGFEKQMTKKTENVRKQVESLPGEATGQVAANV